ncbi:MAG: DEAD/DEAH box helicase family protein [Parcubacteria group bacterium]
MNEQETRSRLIRPHIMDAGWQDHQVREEFPYTLGRIHVSGNKWRRGELKKVDFLLEYQQNLPLAVVEAKDEQSEPGTGMQQALGYADALDVPFVFSSNGHQYLFHDKTGLSGNNETLLEPNNFPSPEQMYEWYMQWKGATIENPDLKTVLDSKFYTEDARKQPRYFQRVAINRTVEAVAKGAKRIFLVMATGTGKTYTAGQIIWRLWKTHNAKRILILADRNILIDQARVNDYQYFGDALTKITRQSFNDMGTLQSYQIFLSLYQAMSGALEEEKLYKKLPKDFFDLIIVDECHRGSANEDSEWHEILQYFSSATQIGMTATPKETAETSSSHYFGDPVYTYSLKQGIDDGFLAPYKVLRIILDNDVTGWRPSPGTLDDDGNEIPDELYELKDVNTKVIFPQRDELVAKKIIEYMEAIGDTFAKTIVFCRRISHAERMRSALVNAAGSLAQENRKYVMKITGDDDEGKRQLDPFIDPEERYPVIVTTSKLMTTGVDAQTCKIIVLDSPIESMTEFKQIIGRGTRIREDHNKAWFSILDFQGATKLFADPGFDGFAERVMEAKEDEDIGEVLEREDPEDMPLEEKEEEDILISTIVDTWDTSTDIIDRPPVYKISSVPYAVIKEKVQYLGPDGKLITETLQDFTKKNILDHYPTLDSFFSAWQEADRRQALIDEINNTGIPLEELQHQVGAEFDLFDLIMHVAYDKKMMKKNERAELVRRSNYLEKYSGQAREVVEALLNKYADVGYKDIEDMRILTLEPFRSIGSDVEIVSMFGGKKEYQMMVDEVLDLMYATA